MNSQQQKDQHGISEEDRVALMEACYEQGMNNADVVRELRRLDGAGLREGIWLLKSLVTKSNHPAVVAKRASVLDIGKY